MRNARPMFVLFDSRIIRRMMCESTLSTNAEIAPMHCCRGEPGCLAGIMLLFQTDWGTQHAGMAVVSVTILALSPSRCTARISMQKS